MTCGVPQGSKLGPLLWNITYDGVLEMTLPAEATLVGFADDLALIVDRPERRITTSEIGIHFRNDD